jgi:NAD(P)H-hydrate epimerase
MSRTEVPALSTDQMREVDRLMIEEYGIELIQMMENAGRNLAMLAKRLLDGEIQDRPVVVLAGRGNNGGGGLVAARHLLNWGAWVQVLCSYPTSGYRGIPAHQLAILQRMEAPLAWAEEGWELPPCDLVVDALIGYGLQGDPRGTARELIQLANSSSAPVLSLDAPSGLDTAAGRLYKPTIGASATMTLALPKKGLVVEPGRSACGDLYLADISVPPMLYSRLDLDVPPLFTSDPLVSLDIVENRAWMEMS